MKVLTAADRVTKGFVLPFMDFPPEIRTRIYGELLVCKPGAPGAWPAIVQTSKEVYAESHSILYGENEVEFKLTADGVLMPGGKLCGTYEPWKKSDTRWLEWPSMLRHCQWLRFTIDLGDLCHPQTINTILYSLCSALGHSNHSLRSIHLELHGEAASYPLKVHNKVFDPLQLLGKVPRLVFTPDNGASTTYKHKVWPAMTELEGDILRRAIPVVQETETYAAIEASAVGLKKTELERWDRRYKDKQRSHLGYTSMNLAGRNRMSALLWGGLNTHDCKRAARLLRDDIWRDRHWENELDRWVSSIAALLDDLNMEEIEAWAEGGDDDAKEKVAEMKKWRTLRKDGSYMA